MPNNYEIPPRKTKLWTDTNMSHYCLCKMLFAQCDLWACDMLLASYTSSCHGDYLCQIILQSQHDKAMDQTRVCHYILCIVFMCIVTFISLMQKDYLLSVTLMFKLATWFLPVHKVHMRKEIYFAYAQRLHAQCDFDLQTSNTVFACDTLSYHNYYLFQIFLKSTM